jgi:hypothetical protein
MPFSFLGEMGYMETNIAKNNTNQGICGWK